MSDPMILSLLGLALLFAMMLAPLINWLDAKLRDAEPKDATHE